MQSYCQRLRILESCRLLSGTELKISEVAHTVGYENLKFFNRLFRELLHMTRANTAQKPADNAIPCA